MARWAGRVVFVRHTLPGERVLARVTEGGAKDRFWRADAEQVLQAAPERVPPPCPLSGPGGCGGCDFQHVSPAGQRALKASVVREQLVRLGGLDPAELEDLQVRPVPGDADGLGWRTRVRWSVGPGGELGLHPHRSHEVLPVPHCPIAHPRLQQLGLGERTWPGIAAVESVAPSGPDLPLLVLHPATGKGRVSVPPLAGEVSAAVATDEGLQRLRGRTWVGEQVTLPDGRPQAFRVTGAGFWQVHPGAAQALLDAVLELAGARPGERVLDLYAGVGLFAAGLGMAVAPDGEVVAVESDPKACADARRSLHEVPGVRIEQGRTERVLPRLVGQGLGPVDVVVLDPPRSGAGRAVLEPVLALRPRAVVYVACDPAALGRDVGIAARAGWRLSAMRAYDLFPMTHHVECVALLEPGSAPPGPSREAPEAGPVELS